MKFEFTDHNGNRGVCDIEQHSTLIIATELAENTAMSVTNACAAIATQYCKQNEIRPWDLFFFERYDERSGEAHADGATLASVKMSIDKNGTFHAPTWIHYAEPEFNAVLGNYKCREILEGLYEEQMAGSIPCPRCGKDPSGRGTALSRRAKVMVCNRCGTDEAMMDVTHEGPILFADWAYFEKS